MDGDAEARIAALERLVGQLAARLEEPAAGGDPRLVALETRAALLERRLALLEAEPKDGTGEIELGGPKEPEPGERDTVDPDTSVLRGDAGGPEGNPREDKSVEFAPGAIGVLQLRNFGKPSSLVHDVAGPDPDDTSDDDPVQFAGRVPKDGDISTGAELKWFELRPKPRLDTDETGEITTPGRSIDTTTVAHDSGKTTKDLQLRQFANTGDTDSVLAADSTASGLKPDDVHVLMRTAKTGERPKLAYVPAGSGPFWVKGAGADQNYGTAIKIGTQSGGYVTISTWQ